MPEFGSVSATPLRTPPTRYSWGMLAPGGTRWGLVKACLAVPSRRLDAGAEQQFDRCWVTIPTTQSAISRCPATAHPGVGRDGEFQLPTLRQPSNRRHVFNDPLGGAVVPKRGRCTRAHDRRTPVIQSAGRVLLRITKSGLVVVNSAVKTDESLRTGPKPVPYNCATRTSDIW